MNTLDLLRVGGRALTGGTPSLSIEITRECPLRCPGCYAYGDDHLGGSLVLRQVRDYKGQELVDAILRLVDHYRPFYMSLVGGEPLVRYKELCQLLPQLAERRIHTQVVTSAVRPIPLEWRDIPLLTITVSIDGLQAEHDARRKPATYERIMKHIQGHQIVVHCTITRQMTERGGYLREFLSLWSEKQEVRKIWMSIFTPQKGESSYEILDPALRNEVIDELMNLRHEFAKLDLSKGVLEVYRHPPENPSECLFARASRSITADLKKTITPCQFGGNPDCSQCGCVASAAFASVARHKLPFGLEVGTLYNIVEGIGQGVGALRHRGHRKVHDKLIPGEGRA